MGERTQMLVTINHDGKQLLSRSIHYQWGFGRVMLLDAFAIGWKFSLLSKCEIATYMPIALSNIIMATSTGVSNIDYKFSDTDVTPYHETFQNMLDYSDQNDGFARLTINYFSDKLGATVELRLYDFNGKHVTLEDYVKKGHGGEYADSEFLKHYRWALENVEIKLSEPKSRQQENAEKFLKDHIDIRVIK